MRTIDFATGKKIPFSLSCTDCDAGDEIYTPEQAAAYGWVDVDYHDGMSWNYLGTCPECKVAK